MADYVITLIEVRTTTKKVYSTSLSKLYKKVGPAAFFPRFLLLNISKIVFPLLSKNTISLCSYLQRVSSISNKILFLNSEENAVLSLSRNMAETIRRFSTFESFVISGNGNHINYFKKAKQKKTIF